MKLPILKLRTRNAELQQVSHKQHKQNSNLPSAIPSVLNMVANKQKGKLPYNNNNNNNNNNNKVPTVLMNNMLNFKLLND